MKTWQINWHTIKMIVELATLAILTITGAISEQTLIIVVLMLIALQTALINDNHNANQKYLAAILKSKK